MYLFFVTLTYCDSCSDMHFIMITKFYLHFSFMVNEILSSVTRPCSCTAKAGYKLHHQNKLQTEFDCNGCIVQYMLEVLKGSLPKSGPLDFATKNTFPLFFVGEEALVGIY